MGSAPHSSGPHSHHGLPRQDCSLPCTPGAGASPSPRPRKPSTQLPYPCVSALTRSQAPGEAHQGQVDNNKTDSGTEADGAPGKVSTRGGGRGRGGGGLPPRGRLKDVQLAVEARGCCLPRFRTRTDDRERLGFEEAPGAVQSTWPAGTGGNAAFLSRWGGQFGIAAARGGLWRLFCPLPARGHHRGAPRRGRACPGLTIGADHAGVLTVLAMALQPAQGPAVSQRRLRPRALHLVQHDRARAWWHSKEDGGWEEGAGALRPGGKGLCTGAAPPEALQRRESGRGRSGLQASRWVTSRSLMTPAPSATG